MDPIVSDKPSYKENELDNTDVFHACAVTRATRKKLEEEETLSFTQRQVMLK